MIEVISNYGPNPAPPRYVYLGKQQAGKAPEPETPRANTGSIPKPVDWSDFILILMRTLMPFPDARDAALAAVEAYEGASP
jgi:hypothetical protein